MIIASPERNADMTYRDELISLVYDQYKDVYGFRPRHYSFSEMAIRDLEQMSQRLDDELGAIRRDERDRDVARGYTDADIMDVMDAHDVSWNEAVTMIELPSLLAQYAPKPATFALGDV
jgi:hypothetical protein